MLGKYVGREVSDKQIGTDALRTECRHAQTTGSETRECEAQTDIITNTTIIPTGMVAQQAAKLNTACFNELLKAKAAARQHDNVDAAKPNEVAQLRQKIDALTLEKNSFKVSRHFWNYIGFAQFY